VNLFQFNPENALNRINASQSAVRVPTLVQSVIGGSLGFGVVSVAAYALWALGGKQIARQLGEGGLYAACAIIYLGLSGAMLNRLIIGPRTLARFYGLFGTAFTAYAVGWSVCWFLWHYGRGEWAGSLLGTFLLAFVFATAFDARRELLLISGVLFATHSLGYFAGGSLHGFVAGTAGTDFFGGTLDKAARGALAKLLWGAAHGLGFGAGLGFALHRSQEPLRQRLANTTPPKEDGI